MEQQQILERRIRTLERTTKVLSTVVVAAIAVALLGFSSVNQRVKTALVDITAGTVRANMFEVIGKDGTTYGTFGINYHH